MPVARQTQVADDVLALLSPAVSAASGELERVYVPIRDLSELSGLLVSVVARDEARQRAARSLWRHDWTIDIAIRKRVGDDVDATDALVLFVEELADSLETTPLPTVPAGLMNIRLQGPDPERLDESGVFLMVISATYQGGRQP